MFDPLTMLAGIGVSAAGTGLGSLFGGGGPTYQPSPVMQELGEYGLDQIKADKKEKKALVSQFKGLKTAQNRGAAEAFLESYKDRFSNPAFIDKRLAKSYKKDIDYNRGGYWDIADELYKQQGIGFSGEEFGQFGEKAKAMGIRSPQAFGDMLKQNLIASGKVMTPQQEMLSYIFGAPARDESGRITNMYQRYIPLDERKTATV